MAAASLARPATLLQLMLFGICLYSALAFNSTSQTRSSGSTFTGIGGGSSSFTSNSKPIPDFRRKAAQFRKDRKLDLHTTVGAKIEVKHQPSSSIGPVTTGIGSSSGGNSESSLSSLAASSRSTSETGSRFSQPVKSFTSGGSGSLRSLQTDTGFRPLFGQPNSYHSNSISHRSQNSASSSQPTQLLNAHPNDRPTRGSNSFGARTGSSHADALHYSLSESRPPSQVFSRRQRDYGEHTSENAAASPSDESEAGESPPSGFSAPVNDESDDAEDFRSSGPHNSGHNTGSSGSEESGSHSSSGPNSNSYDFPNPSDDDSPSGGNGPRENALDDHPPSMEGPDGHHDHHSHHHPSEHSDSLRPYSIGPLSSQLTSPFGPPMLPPGIGGRHIFPMGPPPPLPPFSHLHQHRSPFGPPLPPGLLGPIGGPYKSASGPGARSRFPGPPGGLSPVHPVSLSGSPFSSNRYRSFSSSPSGSSSAASSSPSGLSSGFGSSGSASSPNSERSPFTDDMSGSSMFSPFGGPASFSFEPFSGSSSSSISNGASDSFHAGSSASGLPTASALTGSSPSNGFGSFGFKANDPFLNQPDLLGFSALNNNWYMNQPYLPMMMKQAGVPMMANSGQLGSAASNVGGSFPVGQASSASNTATSGNASGDQKNKDKENGKTRNRLRFNLNRLQSIRLNNIKLPSFLNWANRNSSTTTPVSTA